ncbi:hypothetical protein AVEN_110699-1 [Araneus ventricosus]|uniref:Uncharacterized protein n=1 Tax=Araneus ventricosus TaxID=182803 RepID=A0A4Y2AW54_ARAVE|nr:hypothetical protein AVEN_110699-1 [Araneus ventricosus]
MRICALLGSPDFVDDVELVDDVVGGSHLETAAVLSARVRCYRVYGEHSCARACIASCRLSECAFPKFMNSNRYISTTHRAKHNANATSSSSRIVTIHLEDVDLHTNTLLAITREEGKFGSPCNETYFVMRDIPVVSADGSSGDIEVNEALHAELSLTSWHLCIRQQTPKNGQWTHIGKYERYPSSYERRSDSSKYVFHPFQLSH